MFTSAAIAAILGFASGILPSLLLIGLCLIYGFATAAESGALTSSLVASANPRLSGKTMAVYSTCGFIGAFAGPLVFGLVLNHVGATSVGGWGMAFASLGLGALLGPAALILLDKRKPNPHQT